MLRKCKCGVPIYDRVSKICAFCFLKRLKGHVKKNLFLGGRFYEQDKPNVVGNAEL